MPTGTDLLREIMYRALAEPIGLLIRTDDPERAKSQLYSARVGEPALARLQVRPSPLPDGDLIIVKNDKPLEPLTGPQVLAPVEVLDLIEGKT